MKKTLFLAVALLIGGSFSGVSYALTVGAPVKVAQSENGLMAPTWSPDGSKIAATGPNYTGIFVFEADGTSGKMITDAEGAGYKMAWSNDGTAIIGRTNVRDGVRILHDTKAWNVANGNSRTLESRKRTNVNPLSRGSNISLLNEMTENAAGVTSTIGALKEFAGYTVINPNLSPDGKLIAFQIVGHGMFVIAADGTGLRSLGTGSNPTWMPDNNTLIYTIVRDNGNEYTGSTLMSISLDNMHTQVLINNDRYIPVHPSVTKDGSRLAFENVLDQSIYVVTLK